MSRQSFVETIFNSTADGTAVANTTTESIVMPDITIPGGFLSDGRLLRVIAFGRHSTTGTPTLTFALRWGGVSGTVMAQSGAMTTGSGVTNAMWYTEWYIQVRTNGATGTVFTVGRAMLGEDAAATVGSATNASAVGFMGSAGVAAPAAVTLNLTPDTALSLTADWSAASASNTLTGHVYFVEALN